MRIPEEILRTGYFWLPNNPDKKLPGTLRISDGGQIELEILENFDSDLSEFQTIITIRRILGDIEQDGFVTLDDCIYTSKSFGFSNLTISRLHIHRAYFKVHFSEDEEVKLNEYCFSVEGLDEWLGKDAIKVEIDHESRKATIQGINPEEEHYQLDGGFKVIISNTWKFPVLPAVTEATLSQRTVIRLCSDEKRPLSDFTIAARGITEFISFAIDANTSLRDVTVACNDLREKVSDNLSIPLRILTYYRSSPFSKEPPKVSRFNMLFRFHQIQTQFGSTLSKWLAAKDVYGAATSLYFTSKVGEHKYINLRFLALAQAVETFHRRTNAATRLPQEIFKQYKDAVITNCPLDFKELLQEKLNYANEPTLADRLRQIFKPFEHLFKGDPVDQTIRRIVSTRNYYTHYDKRSEKKAAKGHDLAILCYKLEALFQLHLLNELGFSMEEIVTIASTNRELKRRLES